VFLTDVTSGDERQVALRTVETRLSSSPRGDVVAFRTEDKGALTVAPLGGGRARVVATGAAYFNWSPSGTRLSYVTVAPPHLHVVEADGSGDIDFGETPSLATWSPDGDRFAFARNVNTTAESTYVVERGSSPRLIAPGGVQTWSPDSRFLLVEDLNRQTLRLLRANGEQVVLPDLGAIEWLPDSRGFLVMLQAGPKAGAIASVDTVGGGAVAITKPDSAPRWVGVELRSTATGRIVVRAATAGIPQAVAVDPLRVAVLLKFGKRRVLQIRRRPSLRIERTVPMALSVEHVSLAGRWLVYARAHRIWALDVTSGRTTTIARTRGYVLEPTIEGTRVVWGEQRPNVPDVLLAVTLSR
jgi:dipeptidyl aminopeptidase/acylaminoacyl peptidase